MLGNAGNLQVLKILVPISFHSEASNFPELCGFAPCVLMRAGCLQVQALIALETPRDIWVAPGPVRLHFLGGPLTFCVVRGEKKTFVRAKSE